MKHIALLTTAVAITAGPLHGKDDTPPNRAPEATVTASSEYSDRYLARFVADGIIPKAGGRNSDGKEWAAKGNSHPGGLELRMAWKAPIPVAEIVYYGRSSYAVECCKDYAIYLDKAKKPAVTGTLKCGHGPQRIALKNTPAAQTIRLRFTSFHRCSNPGAAEIEVYSEPPVPKALGRFIPMKPMHGAQRRRGVVMVDAVEESPQLARRLYAGELGFKKMLLVHRHAYNISHVYTYHVEAFRAGGGIYLFTPGPDGGKREKIFAAGTGMIMDCQLSYDGTEILFSYKKKPTPHEKKAKGRVGRHHLNHLVTDRDAKYQIYRMSIDPPGEPTLLTDHYSNNFNPCWLPDGGIAFLSDRKLSFAYCFTSSSPLLHRMDADGSNVVKISHGYLNDFTPSVLNDGRIIYSRWEYVDRAAIPIQSLWSIKPDGTKSEGFFGNRVLEPGTFMEARSIGDTRKVLCVLTAHNGSCRGALGVIDPSRGANAQEAIRNVTPELNIGRVDRGNGNGLLNKGPYENPFPIDENYFLVSKLGTVILRDYDGTGKVTLMAPEDGMGFYSPTPIRPVDPPPVIPSTLPENAEPWATIAMQDVYNGLEGKVRRGEIVQVAVVEEIEKGDFAPHMGIFGFQFPLVSCGATYAPKKLWGYAKIEEDGSAHFRVPSGLPLYFLALDKEGRAVQRMRSLTHFMPGERQSCVGCHSDRNYATTDKSMRSIASRRPPENLEKPEWGQIPFDYSKIVQPVLDRYCVTCHNARKMPKGVDLTGDKTDFFNVSYEHLARKGTHGEQQPMRHGLPNLAAVGENPYVKWIPTINGSEASILMIEPRTWGAYPSALTEIVLSGHPDKDGKKRFEMEEKHVRRLMAWMDLNAVYYDNSFTNHPSKPGSRWMMPPNLNKTLEAVRKRRCAECHKKELPRLFYTRITNVEENNFLFAPLAKAAGGEERCGKAVFRSKDDPDYRAILKTFEPVTKLMAERPRLDFPGAEYVPHENACPKVARGGE